MENKALPEPTTDLSDSDQQKVQAFMDQGLPGLYELKEDSVAKMLDMYLEGKPYTQISKVLRINKTLIMYMSHKYNWFIARREYHHELESTLRTRVVESKIISQDFLLQLTHLYRKKIGKCVDSYLGTDDESHANAIDPKDVDKLLKIMEMLQKLSADPAATKPLAPAVGLNLGDGVTVSKNEDGTVDITPKQKTVADMLKQFADEARSKEKK